MLTRGGAATTKKGGPGVTERSGLLCVINRLNSICVIPQLDRNILTGPLSTT